MPILKSPLAISMSLLLLTSTVGAVTSEPPQHLRYACQSPFKFGGISYNKRLALFKINATGRCGIIDETAALGFGLENVEVLGSFIYRPREKVNASERVSHNGDILLETNLNCDKNPWIHPNASCSTVGTPVNNIGSLVQGPYPVTARHLGTETVLALEEWEANMGKPAALANLDPTRPPERKGAASNGSSSLAASPQATKGFGTLSPPAAKAVTPAPPTPIGGSTANKSLANTGGSSAIAKAVVVVESIAFKPEPLVAGKPVDITLRFKNTGAAASDPGLPFTLACTVKSGGSPCPIAATTRPVSSTGLEPGASRIVTIAGTSLPSAGHYEIVVTVGGVASKPYPFSVGTVTVRPQGVMKKNSKP